MEPSHAPILLVEDEDALRDLLSTALSEHGHPTVAACDGQVALSLLSKQRFSLVITDLQLPLVDGPSLLRWLRGQPQRAETAVLAISARPRMLDAVADKGLADSTLPKPFRFSALLAEVRALL